MCSLSVPAASDLADILTTKSVNVLGIEVKSIEAAPPDPTVEEAIN